MLHTQIPWFIAGPIMGLCVVACRLLFNWRLGVTGGFTELLVKVRRGSVRFDHRGWFVVGIFIGGAVFLLAAGGPDFHGYGWMTRTFHGADRIWIPVLLVVAGGLVGFGAKLSGGCTSGNGLSGTAAFSPASLVATGTFFGTAIVVTFVIKALI